MIAPDIHRTENNGSERTNSGVASRTCPLRQPELALDEFFLIAHEMVVFQTVGLPGISPGGEQYCPILLVRFQEKVHFRAAFRAGTLCLATAFVIRYDLNVFHRTFLLAFHTIGNIVAHEHLLTIL